jgi:hypothetical protein
VSPFGGLELRAWARVTAVSKARVLLASLVVGLATGVNAMVSGQAMPTLVVVQLRSPLTTADTRALRSAREVTAVLPRTKLEVWRLATSPDDNIERLRNNPRVAFVEAMAGATIAAVPIESTDPAQLSAEDRAAAIRLTRGAPRATFRITAARPTVVTMDLVASPLAASLALPLLEGDRPVFTRTSGDASGADGVTWSGREAGGSGEATFIVRPLGVTGTVRYKQQVYSVWPLASGRHLIRRAREFPAEHPSVPPR